MRRRKMLPTMKPYIYRPGLLDATDPKVIKGHAIKAGARVQVIHQGFDPMDILCWIEDEAGNQQSVYKRALTTS